MTGVPGACGQVLHSNVGILCIPYFIETVLVEEYRYIQRVAAGKREVSAEYGDFRRRSHRIVIGLYRVDRAFLHRPEQLASRNQLVCEKKLDLHVTTSDFIE